MASLQELFSQQDGMKRFLERVIEQATGADVQGQLNADRFEKTGNRAG